ncbi:MAG: RepB family plasmid replication initiator protein [Candidatus Amoebophilus sp.]
MNTTDNALINKPVRLHNLLITGAYYSWPAAAKNILYYAMRDLNDNDPVNKVYRVHVRELEKAMGVELKYKQLSEATDKLISRVYTINNIDEVLHISLLSSARYKKGTGIIELKFSKNVRPYLFALKSNFTVFQLYMALSLKSVHSKRLYEMLSQWKDTGIMYITVEKLKLCLGLLDYQTKEEQYKNFNHFEKRIILVAQQELQEHTDISFEYKKSTTGKKVTDLVFLITYKPKKSAKKLVIESVPLKQLQERLTNKFKLGEWQIQRILELIKQDPEKTQILHQTLFDISNLSRDCKIGAIGAYTASVIQSKWPELKIYKST